MTAIGSCWGLYQKAPGEGSVFGRREGRRRWRGEQRGQAGMGRRIGGVVPNGAEWTSGAKPGRNGLGTVEAGRGRGDIQRVMSMLVITRPAGWAVRGRTGQWRQGGAAMPVRVKPSAERVGSGRQNEWGQAGIRY